MIKNIIKISKFEIKRSKIAYDKRLLMVIVPAIILILVLFFFFLQSGEIYRNYFYTANYDDSLEPIILINNKIIKNNNVLTPDLLIENSDKIFIYLDDSLKSKAATESFFNSIKDYNEFMFSRFEEDKFPVWIETIIVRQNQSSTFNELSLESISKSNQIIEETQEETSNKDLINQERIIEQTENINDGELISNQKDINLNNNVQESHITEQNPTEKDLEIIEIENFNKNKINFNNDELKTPSELSPALPFEPIYTALSIIIFLTFITLLYSGRIYDEKVNKKGSLLLITPTKNSEIIIGKTLPHILIALFISLIIAILNVNNFFSIILILLLMLSIILVYLSIAFLIAILSRSFKELSFIGIFGISLYSLFLLIPTFMISFSEASLASPLTIIVKLIMNEQITVKLFLFSIVPHLLLSLLIFYIGSLIFTGEGLFSYKNIISKILDTFQNFISKLHYLLYSSAATIPFVFITELMLIVILISVKSNYVFIMVLLFSAFVEEIFKSIALYTIYSRKLFKMNKKRAILAGLYSGLGFFLGEKIMMVIMITSFIKEYALIIFAGLFIPLILHSVLSIIMSYGLYKFGKKSFIWLLILVSLLHFAANLILSGGFI